MTLLFALCLTGCSTRWQRQSTYYKTVKTQLAVRSRVSSRVLVNNVYVGQAPLEVPLQYEQQMEVLQRRVSYWRTQPGFSVLLTVLSYGIYLPFSGIPVDVESTHRPLDQYRQNKFQVVVDAEGARPWTQTLTCKGERKRTLDVGSAK